MLLNIIGLFPVLSTSRTPDQIQTLRSEDFPFGMSDEF